MEIVYREVSVYVPIGAVVIVIIFFWITTTELQDYSRFSSGVLSTIVSYFLSQTSRPCTEKVNEA